jgi:hypothetical protein
VIAVIDEMYVVINCFRGGDEVEVDEEVVLRRQKQIDYGKNTLEYKRYTEMIPKYALQIIISHPPVVKMNKLILYSSVFAIEKDVIPSIIRTRRTSSPSTVGDRGTCRLKFGVDSSMSLTLCLYLLISHQALALGRGKINAHIELDESFVFDVYKFFDYLLTKQRPEILFMPS